MPTFYCKLIAPRTTFAQDITSAEQEVMTQHAAYWHGVIQRGTRVFALGLVLDPAGAFGIGIVEAEDADAVHVLTAQDPAIRAGIGLRYEIHPIPRGVMHST